MKTKITLLLSFIILLSSCASILTGAKRPVLFESNPNGAKIFVNGIPRGDTPIKLQVQADDRIDFRLDNYDERVVVMDSDFNLVAILNGVSLIGWGIDALTGSLKRVNTKYVKVDLEESSDNTAYIDFAIKNGTITEIKVNTDDKLIETTIILK